MVSNKKKGSKFEEEFTELLSQNGFWAHVIAPNVKDGSQPFDIIAQKYGRSYNFDCKTVDGATFPLSRIEENQEKAFERLLYCGNTENYFVFNRADGTIWLENAQYCIMEKRMGTKSIPPGVISFERWVKCNENRGR